MSKLQTMLYLSRPGDKQTVKVYPLIDTGSDLTLFPSIFASCLGIKPRSRTRIENVPMLGKRIPFWYKKMNLFIVFRK